jgi:hypothetical protein
VTPRRSPVFDRHFIVDIPVLEPDEVKFFLEFGASLLREFFWGTETIQAIGHASTGIVLLRSVGACEFRNISSRS